jgi:hypothetical protein
VFGINMKKYLRMIIKLLAQNIKIFDEIYKQNMLISIEPYRRVWTKPISTYALNYNLFDISLSIR